MASRLLLRVLKEMDVRKAAELYRGKGVTIDRLDVILASMHKARCSLGTKHFTAGELTHSRTWLNTHGYDVPIGGRLDRQNVLKIGP